MFLLSTTRATGDSKSLQESGPRGVPFDDLTRNGGNGLAAVRAGVRPGVPAGAVVDFAGSVAGGAADGVGAVPGGVSVLLGMIRVAALRFVLVRMRLMRRLLTLATRTSTEDELLAHLKDHNTRAAADSGMPGGETICF
ncbi:hypothetical protein DL768_008874 [Monosporascus sp. mg162]|nr:hypothetical protein DL768_008874 [Monosporascus sp. mg162]